MSRPNLGLDHVDKLEGPSDTKQRLKVVLETLSGSLGMSEAAERLGVGLSRMHELRDEALVGALEALSPKPAGRRPSRASPTLRELELERRLDEARFEIELERVRSEVLLVMPDIVVGKRRPPQKRDEGRGGAGRDTKS